MEEPEQAVVPDVTADEGDGDEPAAEEEETRLVDIIFDSATEAAVVAWMNEHKVQLADLSLPHAVTGDTALMLAIRKRMLSVAQSLLQVNAPLSDTNALGDSALHWAAFLARDEAGMPDIVEQLLDAGASANAVGHLGNTPLHLAAAANSAPAIKLLFMNGAQLHPMNRHKQRAEDLCTDATCLRLFEQLRKEGDLLRQELRENLVDSREDAAEVAAARAIAASSLEAEHAAAVAKALARRAEEDASADASAAEDARRRRIEELRQRRTDEARERAAVALARALDDETKRNKKSKAAK